MSWQITHSKVSGKADGADASLIQPSDWNGDHVVVGVEGWRDMVSDINTRGQLVPTWSQMGSSNFWAHKFAINDECWATFHVDHDYKPGTGVYLHVHWTSDNTSTNTVRWEFTYTIAKGHNQSNFNLTGTVVTATGTPHGTAWRHYVTETAEITSSEIEPDSLIHVRIKRITNGGTDNTNGIFCLKTDAHYFADRLATPNKSPDFYS
jgi:hypothetical protein